MFNLYRDTEHRKPWAPTLNLSVANQKSDKVQQMKAKHCQLWQNVIIIVSILKPPPPSASWNGISHPSVCDDSYSSSLLPPLMAPSKLSSSQAETLAVRSGHREHFSLDWLTDVMDVYFSIWSGSKAEHCQNEKQETGCQSKQLFSWSMINYMFCHRNTNMGTKLQLDVNVMFLCHLFILKKKRQGEESSSY